MAAGRSIKNAAVKILLTTEYTEGTEKCEGRGNFIVVFGVSRPSWSGLIFFYHINGKRDIFTELN